MRLVHLIERHGIVQKGKNAMICRHGSWNDQIWTKNSLRAKEISLPSRRVGTEYGAIPIIGHQQKKGLNQ